MVADVVSEERRYSLLTHYLAFIPLTSPRAFVFFQIAAAGLIATLAGVPLAFGLMKYNVWLPMLVGLGIILLGLFAICFLPETLDRHKSHDPSSSSDQHGEGESLLRTEPEEEEATISFSRKSLSLFLERIEESRFVFKSPLLCVLAFTFLSSRLNLVQLLFQLASKRFHWSLGEVCSAPFGSI